MSECKHGREFMMCPICLWTENQKLREVLSDLLECAEGECVSGSAHEPIMAARALVSPSDRGCPSE